MPVTFRGGPRKFAATNPRRESVNKPESEKERVFIGVGSTFTPLLWAWHAHCEWDVCMNQNISDNANAVATNWVESHSDFLFNFAIGQVRDRHIAEDLVQGRDH